MGVEIHFLNVGFGDCTIVHFPSRTRKDGTTKEERIMMIDMYHSEDHEQYENVIEYYKKNFKKTDGSYKPIFRFVCTHPHQDHICGLAKLFEDRKIKVLNFWDTKHSWEPEDFEGHPTHEDDWKMYQRVIKGELGQTIISVTREDTPKEFWNDDEDRINILCPSEDLIKRAHYKEDGTKRETSDIEIDEMSYALLIKVNSRKILLAGDGRESPVWDDILENCEDEIKDIAILKAGHHGQKASFHEEAAKLMNPEIIIFSNSKEQDKANGAKKEYDKACPNTTVLKTCDYGTLKVDVPFGSDDPITVLNCNGKKIY